MYKNLSIIVYSMCTYFILLGGPGKNKMKIIHETDNGVISNHISNHANFLTVDGPTTTPI